MGSSVQSGAAKGLLVLLFVLLALLQYRLWISPRGLSGTNQLQQQILEQQQKNQQQHIINDNLRAEVSSLKSGYDQIEARARSELGMVKPDETFFFIVDKPATYGGTGALDAGTLDAGTLDAKSRSEFDGNNSTNSAPLSELVSD